MDGGLSLDAALDQLREEVITPLEAIKALRKVTGYDMDTAIETLDRRPVWRSMIAKLRRDTDAFFEDFDEEGD